MHNKVRFGIFVIVIALLVAACGGPSKKKTPSSSPPSRPQTGQFQFNVEPDAIGLNIGQRVYVELVKGETIVPLSTQYDGNEMLFLETLEAGDWDLIVTIPNLQGKGVYEAIIPITANERTLVWWDMYETWEKGELNENESKLDKSRPEGMEWPLAKGNKWTFDYEYEVRGKDKNQPYQSEGTFSIEVVSASLGGGIWRYDRMYTEDGDTEPYASVYFHPDHETYAFGSTSLNFALKEAFHDGYRCWFRSDDEVEYVLNCGGLEADSYFWKITFLEHNDVYEVGKGLTSYERSYRHDSLYAEYGLPLVSTNVKPAAVSAPNDSSLTATSGSKTSAAISARQTVRTRGTHIGPCTPSKRLELECNHP